MGILYESKRNWLAQMKYNNDEDLMWIWVLHDEDSLGLFNDFVGGWATNKCNLTIEKGIWPTQFGI